MNRPKIYAFVLAELAKDYPFKIEISSVEQPDVAIIRISGAIYKWRESTSSKGIENQINDLKKNAFTKAEVHLNTPGGDVFEANEIINLLDDNFEEVRVIGGALIASAGTRFMTKYHTTIRSNTQVMIHKPMACACGNEDKVAATLKLLKNVTGDYKTAYAEKMGISAKAVENLWDKGDYWMTAKEAKKQKLADVVLKDPVKMDATTTGMIAACGAPIQPKVIKREHKQNENQMKEFLIAQLGLPADATEAQIQAAFAKMKKQADEAESIKAAALVKEKEDKDAKIKALLDEAEKAKKIDAATRPHYQKLAEADFDSTKEVIEGMQAVGQAPSAGIKPGTGEANERAKWTYQNYLDNDATAEFEELDKETQEKLLAAHY